MIIDEGTEIQLDTLYKVRSSDGSNRSNRYPSIQTDGVDTTDVYISISPGSVDDTDMPKKISDFGSTGADLQQLEAEAGYIYVKKTGVGVPKIWVTLGVDEV